MVIEEAQTGVAAGEREEEEIAGEGVRRFVAVVTLRRDEIGEKRMYLISELGRGEVGNN